MEAKQRIDLKSSFSMALFAGMTLSLIFASQAATFGDDKTAAAPQSPKQSADDKTSKMIKDRFWMWGLGEGAGGGLHGLKKGASRITAMDSAIYMGIPNVMMVTWQQSRPVNFNKFLEQFGKCKRLGWSLNCNYSGEPHDSPKTRAVAFKDIATQYPLTDMVFDDFYANPVIGPDGKRHTGAGVYGIEGLKELRKILDTYERPPKMWSVLYTHQTAYAPQEYLDFFDVISLWTWEPKDLQSLEDNLHALRKRVPNKPIMLGCYLWDFGGGKPMPVDLLTRQCQLGLEWIKSGKIDGMVFAASSVCDLNLEAVEWARQWIAQVGVQEMPMRK